MKIKRAVLAVVVAAMGIAASLVLMAALAAAQPALVSALLDTQNPAAHSLSAQAGDVTFPPGEWPWYAQQTISVYPEPPIAGQPTELCAEVINLDPLEPHLALLEFRIADFGIGMPFEPVGQAEVEVPPGAGAVACVVWVPPEPGEWCIEVLLIQDGEPEPQRGQRNLDIGEPLQPNTPHARLLPVGNPLAHPVTITLGLIPHLPDWGLELSQDILTNVAPGEIREVSLTVTPPGELPPDGSPILDVEAFVEGEVIGGFRKIFRPPIALHSLRDPLYAEQEISIHPYPPMAGEPTEICVELRNPTSFPQDVMIQFSWANFGIGIPFTPIHDPQPLNLPPLSVTRECVHWISPVSGNVCLQVELFLEDYAPQHSQRNIDVDEPLEPNVPHARFFPVGNPFAHPVTITLGLIPHLPDWALELSQDILTNVAPGEVREVSLTVTPPDDLPPDGSPVVDVEAFGEGELIGGFRKVFRSPVPIEQPGEPPYGQTDIHIEPYPPRAGEPTHICVPVRNHTGVSQMAEVEFSVANFGIGIPFLPIAPPMTVELPPHSEEEACVSYVIPYAGQFCVEVSIRVEGYPEVAAQVNVDVAEILTPGQPDHFEVPVGNPFDQPVTITLGLVQHLPDWEITLSPDTLPDVAPGEVRDVTLTVTPPSEFPADGTPIVDVEAFGEGELIGGFRKIFRSPLPIGRPKEPIYAQSEIFVHPYPPRSREPTELIVEMRNPTDEPQTVTVTFSYAPFGIGLPFTPINTPIIVEVPANGMAWPSTMWLPVDEGLWCIQVEIELPGLDEPFYSQRNIDVGEPLEPNTPHSRRFEVGNPLDEPVTITLGLIPHLPDWGLELSPDVLPSVAPGEVREVVLTVTPPGELPPDGHPIVDVEAYVEGELIGGFRKVFRPPVPIQQPKDPAYADSQIGVDPYPLIAGQPAELSVEVFNPTEKDRIVTATFSIAPFGIGLPFTTSNIAPNPIRIFVPATGAARGHVIWEPPAWQGKFCVQVEVEMEGYEPIWSQRNISASEPLLRGQPHSMSFPVGGGPHTGPVTITLGLISHRDGWDVSLSEDSLVNVQPGHQAGVTLTITPPNDAILGTGEPIVDVEGYIEGELVGGFRVLDIPPLPIHKPHEKIYAATELSMEPDPPQAGQDTRVSVVVQNNGPVTATAVLEFGWAAFGVGIPFTNTGMVPYTRTVEAGPAVTATVSVTWTPASSGPQCVFVRLSDPLDNYEDLLIQRNVQVDERPACGKTETFTLTVYNDAPYTNTVNIGLMTFDVPADWVVTTTPSDVLILGPYSEGEIVVTVWIPCPPTLQAAQALQERYALLRESGGVPTINVEAYIDGELVGGIELQFTDGVERHYDIYLPLIARHWQSN